MACLFAVDVHVDVDSPMERSAAEKRTEVDPDGAVGIRPRAFSTVRTECRQKTLAEAATTLHADPGFPRIVVASGIQARIWLHGLDPFLTSGSFANFADHTAAIPPPRLEPNSGGRRESLNSTLKMGHP